jgi:aminopeptidase N
MTAVNEKIKQMRKKYILYLLLFISVGITAQNFPKANDFEARDRFVDIDTISLNLKINPFEKTVDGSAKIGFVNFTPVVDSFFIHAVNFNLKSVLLNGEKVKYKYLHKGGMWIYPQLKSVKRSVLEIEYSAKPSKGLFFVGWDDESGIRKKQIWTQGQGIDNRYWFPSYDLQDEKAIYDLTISFPKDFNLLASGELLSKEIVGSNFRWHYRTKHPMSSYLVMLAGGEYNFNRSESSKLKAESQSPKAKEIDFQYWYYKGNENGVEPTYRYTEEIMSFFEEKIGVSYPWDKYAQIPVSDFKHGAMENTEATIFSDTYFCNDTSFVDQNYISVNAHEMAHQWFGDALTCSSSKHHWLHEGFATFYQLKATGKFIGEDDFLWEKNSYREQIFAISKIDSLPLTHPKAGTERIYYKGALVLMMLERKLGEESFQKAIEKYTAENLYGVVETSTLKSSFEETLEIDLTDFFNQWIYGNGEPKVEIKYFKKGRKRGIELKQINGVFDFDLPIVTTRKTKKKELLFSVNSEVDTLYFNGRIDFFEVDPDVESLVEDTVVKPQNQWKEQVLRGKTSYSRAMAIKQFSNLEEGVKLKLYSEIGIEKENHKVLAEVYSQIKSIEFASDLKQRILQTNDAELRKDIVFMTDTILVSEKKYFESYLNTKSYLVISESLNLLCDNFPESADKYLSETKDISGYPIPYVKLSWLKNAVIYGIYSNAEKQKFADELVSFTSKSYDFNTRLLALNKVFEIQYFTRQLLVNLINGSVSFNHRLAGPFRQVMKEVVKNESFRSELNLILEQEKLSDAERMYLEGLLLK